jgi:hypothetical protein
LIQELIQSKPFDYQILFTSLNRLALVFQAPFAYLCFMKLIVRYSIIIISSFLFTAASAPNSIKIAVLKYNGGGDWYANPTALTNLALYANKEIHTSINPNYEQIEVGSVDLFNFPFVHMTGHGNVVFSESEAQNLRLYLVSGGFLHIDDNYGMDKFIRAELKKVFPEYNLRALSPSHEIFHLHFDFPKGLPKIHEHDNKPPEALGIFHEKRLVVLYTTESDLGDGWEDEEVHNDPAEKRQQALQMGCNILEYAFNQNH